MIWFNAESAGMSTRPSACGPIAIPVTRNTATSGILIFRATKPATMPIARIMPHANSVCLAISMEAEVSRMILSDRVLTSLRLFQRLEPAGDFGQRDVGLRQQLAHGEEAVELAGKMPVGHGHAGLLQPRGIFVAFVAQRIGAGGHDI